jgi:hypothetical protein
MIQEAALAGLKSAQNGNGNLTTDLKFPAGFGKGLGR